MNIVAGGLKSSRTGFGLPPDLHVSLEGWGGFGLGWSNYLLGMWDWSLIT